MEVEKAGRTVEGEEPGVRALEGEVEDLESVKEILKEREEEEKIPLGWGWLQRRDPWTRERCPLRSLTGV